jgi:SAM-dependent methyltransferase
MSRFMLLDRGEELSAETAARVRNASAALALRLLDETPPLREGQIIHVSPRQASDGRARGIVLCQRADDFHLSSNGPAPAEVLGRVVAVQRGPAIYAIDRGLLALVPSPWLGGTIDALEVLARFGHPLSPPLAFGSPHALLAAVRDKYGREGEVCRYSALVVAAAEAFELELVARHVRPGGSILDIGCGAGREAIGFVRAGFRVVGIDIAPAMVAASRRNARALGLTIDFKIQSATDLDEPSDTYDGAFFSGSFQHVPGRALRIDTLRRIGRSLKPDGALILAVTYREPLGLLSRTRLVDALRVLRTKISGDARFGEPGDGYMRDVSEASDSREPIFFHAFLGPEHIRSEIEAAGLIPEEVSSGWWVCRRAA